MKTTLQQQCRRHAVLERFNRGVELTAHWRSKLQSRRAADRHCHQFLAAARRRGWRLAAPQ